MKIIQNEFLIYLQAEIFDGFKIKHAFFTRHGGVSPEPWLGLNLATSVGDSRKSVVENRFRLFNALRLNPENVFDVWQVHSNHIVNTDKPRPLAEPHQKADGIITQTPNLTLLMLFADCVPILVHDPVQKAIGIAHAGWVGTINRITESLVEKMKNDFGSNPEDLHSVIGPCIGVDHYEIGKEVYKKAEKCFPNHPEIFSYFGDRVHLNLSLANEIVLKTSGLKKIQRIDVCTACNTDDWYSHRGEGGMSGRFGAIISLID